MIVPDHLRKRGRRGAGWTDKAGYRYHSDKQEHIAIAEKALGKPLPPEAEVHHVDGDKAHNGNSNLVICPTRAYHMLLHMRTRALAASGNPNFRPCVYCKVYDDTANMYIHAHQLSPLFAHRKCNSEYRIKQRRERNESRRAQGRSN